MFAVGQPEIWQGAVHSGSARVFTFALAVLFPTLDYVLYKRLKSTQQIYVWNILALWSLTAGCIWTSRLSYLTLSDLGEQAGNAFRTLVVCGIVAATVFLLVKAQKVQKKKATPEQVGKALENVRRLLPKTSTERATWVFVSISAGLCEEFLYRGWLLTLFSAALGSVWLGLLISSIIFGVAHAYQGRNGIIGTGILGAIFGIVFVVSGSLIPGQLLHTAMDLYNGLAWGKVAYRSIISSPAQDGLSASSVRLSLLHPGDQSAYTSVVTLASFLPGFGFGGPLRNLTDLREVSL